MIQVGGFDADLRRISDADWIIEAVVEQLDVKRSLLEKVDAVRRRGTFVYVVRRGRVPAFVDRPSRRRMTAAPPRGEPNRSPAGTVPSVRSWAPRPEPPPRYLS